MSERAVEERLCVCAAVSRFAESKHTHKGLMADEIAPRERERSIEGTRGRAGIVSHVSRV